MNVAEMIEWRPEHALVVHHPNGDHFYPQWATAALETWQRLEEEIGHEAWMNNVARRARGSEN